MSAFRWTARRDALLAECRLARFSWTETERAVGCRPGAARVRWRELQEYQGACGTAREAPTGSSSGDPVAEGTPQAEDTARPATCDTVSAPAPAGNATGSPDVSPAPTPPLAKGIDDPRRSRERRAKGWRAIDAVIAAARVAPETPPQAETTAKEPGPASDAPPKVEHREVPKGTQVAERGASVRQVGASPAVTPYDPRPRAESREACWKCGTRGDIGCRHQRAFVGG